MARPDLTHLPDFKLDTKKNKLIFFGIVSGASLITLGVLAYFAANNALPIRPVRIGLFERPTPTPAWTATPRIVEAATLLSPTPTIAPTMTPRPVPTVPDISASLRPGGNMISVVEKALGVNDKKAFEILSWPKNLARILNANWPGDSENLSKWQGMRQLAETNPYCGQIVRNRQDAWAVLKALDRLGVTTTSNVDLEKFTKAKTALEENDKKVASGLLLVLGCQPPAPNWQIPPDLEW